MSAPLLANCLCFSGSLPGCRKVAMETPDSHDSTKTRLVFHDGYLLKEFKSNLLHSIGSGKIMSSVFLKLRLNLVKFAASSTMSI